MKKLKVMSIFGTRPEATKMLPVIKELEKCASIQNKVLVTAQHREMLDQVLEMFDVKPDYDLDIMQKKQTLTGVTVKALTGIENVLDEARPDLILVHGDTTTTFAAALAAFYARIKVGHVEAGLRTYDKTQPYPEEMNRMLATALADIYFAPTKHSKENLLKENVNPDKIFVTGNTAIDCLKYSVKENYVFENEALNAIDFNKYRVLAVTSHRNENHGQPRIEICNALKDIIEKFDDVIIVYAVHPNPVVRETVHSILGKTDRICLTNFISMSDMHNLMKKSYVALTDSGGIQEEAPALNKPVIVLRNVTERPEGVLSGSLTLAGNDREKIFQEASSLLNDKDRYQKMSRAKNPFGDGEAAKRIVSSILYGMGLSAERPVDFN